METNVIYNEDLNYLYINVLKKILLKKLKKHYNSNIYNIFAVVI